jgi:hypothetical protein
MLIFFLQRLQTDNYHKKETAQLNILTYVIIVYSLIFDVILILFYAVSNFKTLSSRPEDLDALRCFLITALKAKTNCRSTKVNVCS